MKNVAPGFTILKRYGPYKNACWVLQHGKEAAVVEMPLFSASEKPPYERLASYLRRRKLHLKYALVTHGHVDHCKSLPQFRAHFPQARFVAHRSLLEDRSFLNMMARNPALPLRAWNEGSFRLFDEVYDGPLWTGHLNGEALHLIYAPKHSYTDQLVLFRGGMITGDWYLGDLRDCNAIVRPEHKVLAIDSALSTVRYLNHKVHMLFSGHGDCLFYRVDFADMMERSKVYH
jgi:hydroxyacylglutathione hydrolase